MSGITHRLRPGLTTYPTELHAHSIHAMLIEFLLSLSDLEETGCYATPTQRLGVMVAHSVARKGSGRPLIPARCISTTPDLRS